MRSPLSSTTSTSPSSLSNHFSIITSISLTSVWLQERQKDYPQEQRRIPKYMNIQVQSVSYLIQPIVGGYQICLVFQHKALEWIWVQSLHCERFQQGYKVLKLRNFIFKLYHHVFKIWKKVCLANGFTRVAKLEVSPGSGQRASPSWPRGLPRPQRGGLPQAWSRVVWYWW